MRKKIIVLAFLLAFVSGYDVRADEITAENWQGWEFTGAVAMLNCGIDSELCDVSPGGVLELSTHKEGGFKDSILFANLLPLISDKPDVFGKIARDTPIQGSLIFKQVFTVKTGDILTFDWRFLSTEDKNQNEADDWNNDFAFVSPCGDKDESDMELLTDVKSEPEDCPGPRCVYHVDTDMRHYRHVFSHDGYCNLLIGVMDVKDEGLSSRLRVGHMALTPAKAEKGKSS